MRYRGNGIGGALYFLTFHIFATMKNPKLLVAEHFYSIQGEGASAGVPAVFLRLGGCNLLCGRNPDDTPADGATWECDTIDVWRKGKRTDICDLLNTFEVEGYLDRFKYGAHLVITGGEPLLQEAALIEFLKALRFRIAREKGWLGVYVEVETNGTIMPQNALAEHVAQWNVSPKLANSGQPKDKRYNPSALMALREYGNGLTEFGLLRPRTYFKFVVTSPADMEEIGLEFMSPGLCFPSQVILMPGASSRGDLLDNSEMVADLCKKYGVRYSSRLQLEIWNQTTGV